LHDGLYFGNAATPAHVISPRVILAVSAAALRIAMGFRWVRAAGNAALGPAQPAREIDTSIGYATGICGAASSAEAVGPPATAIPASEGFSIPVSTLAAARVAPDCISAGMPIFMFFSLIFAIS
jgi:hypothetical protein